MGEFLRTRQAVNFVRRNTCLSVIAVVFLVCTSFNIWYNVKARHKENSTPQISNDRDAIYEEPFVPLPGQKEDGVTDTVNVLEKVGAKPAEPHSGISKAFPLKLENGETIWITDVLTDNSVNISLKERLTCKADRNAPPKLILTSVYDIGQGNLAGCPEWNCQIRDIQSHKNQTADAIINSYMDQKFMNGIGIKRNSQQYHIFYSQEAPPHADATLQNYNFSFGYRHDSPGSSPYGYTVKLAPRSRRHTPYINEALVIRKRKAVAWFASHCETPSRREDLVNEMKKTIKVDVYGVCGSKRCEFNGKCEDILDLAYHFYLAFENSVCQDYMTEKLFYRGYSRDIIPVVLKRSIVEPYVPPHSFIAVDDFNTVAALTDHMKYLMRNKTAYMEYFAWRRDYQVVFLSGKHGSTERLWGICQICRLLWEEPRKQYIVKDFVNWWEHSCEKTSTVERILGLNTNETSVEEANRTNKKKNPNDFIFHRNLFDSLGRIPSESLKNRLRED